MSKAAVIYWSGTGNTEAMANAVVEGAKAKGAEVSLFTADEFDASMLDALDAVAFGCPAMGAEVLEEDEFEPMFEAVEGSLSGKKVALFGSYDWGTGDWMDAWRERTEGDGAEVVGTAIANLEPDDDALAACKELGAALA